MPGADRLTAPDVRQRFLLAPPRPFDARGLPLAQAHTNPALADGYVAVWGSLGSQSDFTPGFTAPPHYVLAAAAAEALDFVALADLHVIQPPVAAAQTTYLPAWRWQEDSGAQAIIYSRQVAPDLSHSGLASFLGETGAPVQWQSADEPASAGVVAMAGVDGSAPGDMAAWFKQWRTLRSPVLPAGNSNPDLPGAIVVQPRYTGLAAAGTDEASLQEALQARRGWLTTTPGLWLTLRADAAGEETEWMGGWLAPGNAVTLHIDYGDRSGQPAGLAIWQDNRPIRQLDIPPSDGRWTVDVPAVPGSVIVAVATQADGDFALTAPLMVAEGGAGVVVINEVLPIPLLDHNRDGITDGNDEFIELYNPGTEPVALAGWQLSDLQGDSMPGRRFTFGIGRHVGGGDRLLLWRKETRINLNNDIDSMRLLAPDGAEMDAIGWDRRLPAGSSLARLPDGGGWLAGADVTPGRTNSNSGIVDTPPDSERPPGSDAKQSGDDKDPNEIPAVPTLEPTYGQAGGAPDSIAQSKLAGLDAWVGFRAIVTAPPGLYHGTIYVADLAGDGATAGIGINVYLQRGDFPPLQEGDIVLVRGMLDSFRGEMELALDGPDAVWKVSDGAPLRPLTVTVAAIGEALEGRLVSFSGVVSGWQGDSIYLSDPDQPEAEPIRVTVRTSLGWKRPYVKKGQVWQVVGVVSQFAKETPWNGGYRVLVRYQTDLQKIGK